MATIRRGIHETDSADAIRRLEERLADPSWPETHRAIWREQLRKLRSLGPDDVVHEGEDAATAPQQTQAPAASRHLCTRCGETDKSRFQSGQRQGRTVCDDCRA